MIKFLGLYRGAAIYEVDDFEPEEYLKDGSRIIAKAMTPELNNKSVEFVEQAADLEMARSKIEHAIDEYLSDNDMDRFIIDIF